MLKPVRLNDKLLTMQETMNYLCERGYPCRSRNSFYRMVKEFGITYVNTNPNGKHEVRRFPLKDLQEFLRSQGLEP